MLIYSQALAFPPYRPHIVNQYSGCSTFDALSSAMLSQYNLLGLHCFNSFHYCFSSGIHSHSSIDSIQPNQYTDTTTANTQMLFCSAKCTQYPLVRTIRFLWLWTIDICVYGFGIIRRTLEKSCCCTSRTIWGKLISETSVCLKALAIRSCDAIKILYSARKRTKLEYCFLFAGWVQFNWVQTALWGCSVEDIN